MFRLSSHRTAVGVLILAAVLGFSVGCTPKLVVFTDPPHCSQCQEDVQAVTHIIDSGKARVKIYGPEDCDRFGIKSIPEYRLYDSHGHLIYRGHDITEVEAKL